MFSFQSPSNPFTPATTTTEIPPFLLMFYPSPDILTTVTIRPCPSISLSSSTTTSFFLYPSSNTPDNFFLSSSFFVSIPSSPNLPFASILQLQTPHHAPFISTRILSLVSKLLSLPRHFNSATSFPLHLLRQLYLPFLLSIHGHTTSNHSTSPAIQLRHRSPSDTTTQPLFAVKLVNRLMLLLFELPSQLDLAKLLAESIKQLDAAAVLKKLV